jgi:hypothetical protein
MKKNLTRETAYLLGAVFSEMAYTFWQRFYPRLIAAALEQDLQDDRSCAI